MGGDQQIDEEKSESAKGARPRPSEAGGVIGEWRMAQQTPASEYGYIWGKMGMENSTLVEQKVPRFGTRTSDRTSDVRH